MSSASPGQRFADYFAICGLDVKTGLEPDQLSGDSLNISPLDRSYNAKVFAHFPHNVDWNPFDEDATRMLCLPQGLTFRKKSECHEPNFHSFLITREDGTRVYGAAFTFYEEVRDKQIIVAMETLQQMHDAELSILSSKSRKRSSAPMIPDALIPPDPPPLERCVCEQPGIQSNRRTFDSKEDTLLVAKCICMIIQLPFISAAKSFLEQLYEVALSKKESYLPLECYIYNLIFEVPLPPPGRTMRFTCTGDNITCQRPGLNELPLFDYSLKELCGLLGVENTVLLFTCTLLEYQILMVSDTYHRFMLVAESLTNLIFPFIWQHVYVPILPASLNHFLDAPVPFIMGLYCKTEEDKRNLILPSEASLCFVDIDIASVTTPEELPELPNKQSLINELYDAIDKFNVPLPESSQSTFESSSNRNSLEIPCSDCSANGSADYDSTGSNHSSPKGSKSNSPVLERKRLRSPKSTRRSCPPVLSAREKPTTRVKTQRTNKVSKSKSSTSLYVSNNPRLKAIAAIAERTGIIAPISTVVASLEKSVSDTELSQYCEEDVPIMGDPAKEISRQQQHENEFNAAMREIFANWFTQVLLEYESFVIQPQQDMEQWFTNREQMQNFDKAAFLSDQPNQFLPFLSPFTETQMFASFIDMKIMATWEEPEPRLAVFDQRVEGMKSRLGVVRSPSYEKCNTLNNAIQVLLRRSNSVDHMAIYPHQLVFPIKKEERRMELFADLYGDILSDSPFSKGGRQPKVNWKKRGRQKQHSEHLLLNTSQDGKKIRDKMAISLKKYMQESKTKTQSSQLGDLALESTQSTFIQRLLKECRQKTKRMLVQKMGQEAVDLGHGDASVSGVEENTLIASLCDLLERVWSHGLQTKEGKSALWSHLLAYQASHGEEVEDEALSTPSSHTALSSGPRGAEAPASPSKKPVPRKISAGSDLAPQSISVPRKPMAALLADMGVVQQMTQIKTDVGHARAWTRLALEKKVLSKHLPQLLSDDEILKQRYKDYAFLRTEEEREQFFYHLLSLTAVDFFCFTNCFTSTPVAYKVVIKTGKPLGGGSTSANAWMTLAGELADTGVINLPKNENEFRFKHINLGVLTTLRIGHDNSGLSPSWFIEQVIVKNEVTGHIYRFPCGRWLSKTNDDGSFERLLVAERVHPKVSEDSLSDVCRLAPQKKSPVLSRKSSIRTRIPDVQEKLADSVNSIVKFFYKPEKERGNLTYLLCGDGGLCQSLEQVFQCGFKSFSLFRNSFFIWDILEKAQQYLTAEGDEGVNRPDYLRKARKSFCTIITRINNSSNTIGKDGKFQSFVCLGARDHLLHDWLQLISTCPATINMYDNASFFRDQALMQFLVDVLSALVEFNITLEASLLKGIS